MCAILLIFITLSQYDVFCKASSISAQSNLSATSVSLDDLLLDKFYTVAKKELPIYKEFRGILTFSFTVHFSIVNPTTQTSIPGDHIFLVTFRGSVLLVR